MTEPGPGHRVDELEAELADLRARRRAAERDAAAGTAVRAEITKVRRDRDAGTSRTLLAARAGDTAFLADVEDLQGALARLVVRTTVAALPETDPRRRDVDAALAAGNAAIAAVAALLRGDR